MKNEQDQGLAKESARKAEARDDTRGDREAVQQQGTQPDAQEQRRDGQRQTDEGSQGKEGGSIESHKVKEDLHQSVRKT